jgi:uncharacterized membrane protein
MIRKILSRDHHSPKQVGERRDSEIQRIETFSDAVFAFAVTLLIVSLEVPKSFEELATTMRGFFAFGISFTLLILIWHEQHRFFRNYGMDDTMTVALNGALLFLVLFYVYPVKFLFTLIFSDQIYGVDKGPVRITQHQYPQLLMIYALGFMAIYTLFFLMYLRVYLHSERLGLTAAERYDCKSAMYKILVMVTTGLISLIAAYLLPDNKAGASGFIYFLIGPAISIVLRKRKKIRKKRFPESPAMTEGN